jgi:hypothetical protein
MDVQQILKEIESLPQNMQLEILSKLSHKLKKYNRILGSLDELRGLGKGLWDNEDAQQYINRLRANDRF